MKPQTTGLLAVLITLITAALKKWGVHAPPVTIAAASTGIITAVHTLAHPPVKQKLKRAVPKRFRGNPSLGLWVWEGTNATTDAKRCRAHGYGWLALKVHEGGAVFAEDRITAYRDACEKYGIKFGVWGYCRHWTDASLAAELCHKYGAHFYLADVEVEFERSPRADAGKFAALFRRLAPGVDPWLSSFGRVDLHPDIDYRAFANHGFGFMPQAYSCESAELAPAACLHHALDYFDHSRIQPTLGAYSGARGRIPSQQLRREAQGLHLSGVNVWVAQTATPTDLAQVAKVL